ncbi:glycosyltransferase [Candidatus Bathyarchaeota archaeon]|nr:glycosyltransferase [Candidatus Bathyarchaeota archaeon]
MRKVSLVMPIHNEEEYLPKSLKSLKEIEDQLSELIFILDRCTDNSEGLVKHWFPNAKIIKKNVSGWRNSLAENFQLGLQQSKGEVICTMDADIAAPNDLDKLLQELKGDVASVAPRWVTCKSASRLNWLYYYWEKTRSFAPLGQAPAGGFRLIRRDCLEQVDGFKDVITQETQLDIDFRSSGYKSISVDDVTIYHLRKFSFRTAIKSQIYSGRMRRNMHMSFWRVLGHSLLRLRFFVVYGYVSEYIKGESTSKLK